MTTLVPNRPDEVKTSWRVRKCDNWISVCVSQTPNNTYVFYERLVDGTRWEYVEGSAVGMGDRHDAISKAMRMYDEAPVKFDTQGRRRRVTPEGGA